MYDGVSPWGLRGSDANPVNLIRIMPAEGS